MTIVDLVRQLLGLGSVPPITQTELDALNALLREEAFEQHHHDARRRLGFRSCREGLN